MNSEEKSEEQRSKIEDPCFVHLHTHSYYSFFDSTLSPEQLVALALKHGHNAVALTDINCMTGAVVFYKFATEAKLNPILGVEITQPLPGDRKLLRDRAEAEEALLSKRSHRVGDSILNTVIDVPESEALNPAPRPASLSPALCHGDKSRRAVLLARSFEGYSEICEIVTRRMLDPAFDLLSKLHVLSQQVIVLSDSPEVLECRASGGETSHSKPTLYALLIASRRSRARNRKVYDCARRFGIPLVAGCDVKLATPDDAPLHHLLQAMRRLTTVYQLRDADKIDPAQHFQSSKQVARFFGLERTNAQPADDIFAHLREAILNTTRIAERCCCSFLMRKWKFPRLPGNPIACPNEELRRLVTIGMHKRYSDPLPTAVRDRMNSELEIIEKLGFAEYFLLVNCIVSEAHRRGFFTVGRGSGANSILSYALGFTEVCPIKFKLYFERFLNPDRSVPPDIDIDFSWKERDELLQWCFEYFGRDRVALICTIQTLQARQSIREVGKAFGLSENEVNAFNRLQETKFHVEEQVNCESGKEEQRSTGEARNSSSAPGPQDSHSKSSRRVYNLADQEPWRTVLRFAQRITGFPRHLSIHCGGILITPEPVTKFLPLTRSAKGFVITQMDMFSVEDLGLIKIDLLSNRSLGVLKDALRMAERNLHTDAPNSLPDGAPQLPESSMPAVVAENPGKVEVFQREAMRMKLAGTRRGTSVALAGVLGSFATCVQTTVANELVPQSALTLREQALNFHWVTNDAVTRQVIDQGLTMGCFYIESPGMRALFERLRCKNFEEVVAASSIIRPGVAESGMMQEYITRHQEQHPQNELQITDYQVIEEEDKETTKPTPLSYNPAEDIHAGLAQIEPLSVTLQMATMQRETQRAGEMGNQSGARVAVALDVNTSFVDPRSPTTLLPLSTASERLANGAMPINAHAKSRALEEYLLPSASPQSERPIISYHSSHASSPEPRPRNHAPAPQVEAIRGYTIQPQGRSASRHGSNKKLRIHRVMMEMLPETYGVMVYQEDVLRVAHDLAGMSYAEADLLRRAISGKMRSRDALLAIQDHFITSVMEKGLPHEDAEEIWRQMASFAGYSFCKGHSAAFAVLSYQVAFMKAHYPAEFFAGVLTNEGGFYGAHAYLEEARRWGLEIHQPCVNASQLDYVGLTLNAAAARAAAGLQTEPPRTVIADESDEKNWSDGLNEFQESPHSQACPFPLPLGTGRAGWISIGLMAIQGARQETKELIVRTRNENGAFESIEDLMERTPVGFEECRAFIMAGALDSLADDAPPAEPWEPKDPRRVLHKRRALLLKTECLFRAREAGLTCGFVKLTFPIWKNYESRSHRNPAHKNLAPEPSRTCALLELCKLEAEILSFTFSAHPLDLVHIPPEVVPARDIRSHNHKCIYMAGWMISAKLIATRTTGQAMKMLTLEDNSGTFEAVLFPRVYAKFAARTLGRGPYLVCGKVDMTLGSPTLNVEKLDILPTRRD